MVMITLYAKQSHPFILNQKDGKTRFSLSQRPATPKTAGPQLQSLQERILHDCSFGSPSPQVQVPQILPLLQGLLTLNNPTPASDPSPHPQPTPVPL